MMQRIAKVAQSVDRLSLRERLLLLAAGLFVLGGLWQAVLAGPLEARERTATDTIAALQGRLLELEESQTAAAVGVTEGMPDQLQRLNALRESVRARDEEVRVFTTDLIDPHEMRVVLEELLRRQDGLTLVSAVNRPALALVEDEAAEAQAADTSDAPKLYRHSLVLKLRGNYLDVLRYLEDVERLPWHIYWASLELSIDEYPVNDVVLEVATLSLDEEWIGV